MEPIKIEDETEQTTTKRSHLSATYTLTQDFNEQPTKIHGGSVLKEKLKNYFQNVLYAICIQISTKNNPVYSLFDTLTSIATSLSYLGALNKKVVVVAMLDGVSEMDELPRESLKEFGFITQLFDLDEVIANAETEDQEDVENVQIFQKCKMTIPLRTQKGHNQYNIRNSEPFDLYLCIKSHKRHRLNSHYLFMKKFCRPLQPNLVVLMHCGTLVHQKALSIAYKAFTRTRKQDLAAISGEIRVREFKGLRPTWNETFQDIEYRIINFMEKPLEDFHGAVSTLPDKFWILNWSSINKDEVLWKQYFKYLGPIDNDLLLSSKLHANLAKDRVIARNLLYNPGSKAEIRHLKRVIALTNVPENTIEIIDRKRAQLIGSWFILFDIWRCIFSELCRTNHRCWRKLSLLSLLMYKTSVAIFVYFSSGIFGSTMIAAIRVLIVTQDEDNEELVTFLSILAWFSGLLYLVLIVMILLTTMGNLPKSNTWYYRTLPVLTSLLTLMGLVSVLYALVHSIQNKENEQRRYGAGAFVVVLFAALFVYILLSVIHGHSIVVLRNLYIAVFLIPIYISVYVPYSFGTMGNMKLQNLNNPYFKNSENLAKVQHSLIKHRTKFIACWFVLNFTYGAIFASLPKLDIYYLPVVCALALGILVVKAFGSVSNWLKLRCCKKLQSSGQKKKPKCCLPCADPIFQCCKEKPKSNRNSSDASLLNDSEDQYPQASGQNPSIRVKRNSTLTSGQEKGATNLVEDDDQSEQDRLCNNQSRRRSRFLSSAS